MILVTGADGTVGTALVKELQLRGERPRMAYYSGDKAEKARAASQDAVALDFAKPETIRPALAGVDKVFLLGTGGLGQAEGEINVVNETKAAGIRRIVKLSVWQAETEAFEFARIHRRVERAIEAPGLEWTFLRPNGFMQNFANYMGATIKAQNAFYQNAAHTRTSHIDARDIARVAAVGPHRERARRQGVQAVGPPGPVLWRRGGNPVEGDRRQEHYHKPASISAAP